MIYQVDALPDLSHLKQAAVDVETTRNYSKNSDPFRDRLVSVQVSDGENVYILSRNFASLIPLLTNPNTRKLAHNASFDLKFLKHNLGGIEIGPWYDTLLSERLLTSGSDLSNGLEAVLARRCGIFTDKSIRDEFSAHTGQFTEQQLQYMATDVLYLSKIREQQLVEISKAGMGRVLALENSVVPVVAQMELDGVGFDRNLWAQHVLWFEQKKEEIKERICSYLDVPYMPSLFGGMDIALNLSSSEQVKEQLSKLGCVLFDTREATLQEALIEYGGNEKIYKFLNDILLWRGYEKLLGYDYPKFVNEVTGNIHSSWNPLAADTGRFSSSGPNLQQARRPVEGEPNIRAIFPPDSVEDVYVVADYSQQEPRVLAQISQDPAMIKAANEIDIYAAYGEFVYGHIAPKGSNERHLLKTAVLADSYGAGPKKLAYVLKISESDARKVQERLHSAFLVAHRWGDRQVQQVAQKGVVYSLMGRRRLVLEAIGAKQEDIYKFSNIARNSPVQMTSADISKEAMRRYDAWAKTNGYNKARIRLVVHDEIVVQCPKSQADEVKYALVGAMETSMEDVCPQIRAEVEAHISDRWTK